MTDLYLIAHKVRGEPAFDIAERMPCPECAVTGCDECESLGYWWIIPTSGHRAYPFWSRPLDDLVGIDNNMIYSEGMENTNMPSLDAVPDHYPSTTTPSFTGSLLAKLGLRKSANPITRRL